MAGELDWDAHQTSCAMAQFSTFDPDFICSDTQDLCGGWPARRTPKAGDAHDLDDASPYTTYWQCCAGLVWRVAGETDSEAEDSEYEDEEDHVPAG